MLVVELVYVSDSLFPHFAGPPGYEVPRSKSQFVEEGRVPALPVKVSRNIEVKFGFVRPGFEGLCRG